MLDEYKRFLLRGNVVDLAVGVVAGAAFGAVVASLVTDIITPLVAAVFGQPDFSSVVLDLGKGEIKVGSFLNALITFFLTMTGIFFLIVKPVNLAVSRFVPADQDEGPKMRECPDCLSDIPARARRCSHCAIEVTPVTS